jgi:trehalose-6-phosphate synthase
MARLIVVSNRLPLVLRRVDERWTTERSFGGLANAMNPLLQKTCGHWLGASGNQLLETPAFST